MRAAATNTLPPPSLSRSSLLRASFARGKAGTGDGNTLSAAGNETSCCPDFQNCRHPPKNWTCTAAQNASNAACLAMGHGLKACADRYYCANVNPGPSRRAAHRASSSPPPRPRVARAPCRRRFFRHSDGTAPCQISGEQNRGSRRGRASLLRVTCLPESLSESLRAYVCVCTRSDGQVRPRVRRLERLALVLEPEGSRASRAPQRPERNRSQQLHGARQRIQPSPPSPCGASLTRAMARIRAPVRVRGPRAVVTTHCLACS